MPGRKRRRGTDDEHDEGEEEGELRDDGLSIVLLNGGDGSTTTSAAATAAAAAAQTAAALARVTPPQASDDGTEEVSIPSVKKTVYMTGHAGVVKKASAQSLSSKDWHKLVLAVRKRVILITAHNEAIEENQISLPQWNSSKSTLGGQLAEFLYNKIQAAEGFEATVLENFFPSASLKDSLTNAFVGKKRWIEHIKEFACFYHDMIGVGELGAAFSGADGDGDVDVDGLENEARQLDHDLSALDVPSLKKLLKRPEISKSPQLRCVARLKYIVRHCMLVTSDEIETAASRQSTETDASDGTGEGSRAKGKHAQESWLMTPNAHDAIMTFYSYIPQDLRTRHFRGNVLSKGASASHEQGSARTDVGAAGAAAVSAFVTASAPAMPPAKRSRPNGRAPPNSAIDDRCLAEYIKLRDTVRGLPLAFALAQTCAGLGMSKEEFFAELPPMYHIYLRTYPNVDERMQWKMKELMHDLKNWGVDKEE